MTRCTFYPFIVVLNVAEGPRNEQTAACKCSASEQINLCLEAFIVVESYICDKLLTLETGDFFQKCHSDVS